LTFVACGAHDRRVAVRARSRLVVLASLFAVGPLATGGCGDGTLTDDGGAEATGNAGAGGGAGNGGSGGSAGSVGRGGSGGATGAAGTVGRGGKGGSGGSGGSGGTGGSAGASGRGGGGGAGTGGSAGRGGSGGGGTGGGAGRGGTSGGGGQGGSTASLPAGWLFTSGNKVHVSDGNGGGPVWVGRGVNIDDIFFCGYNNTLWMSAPEQNVSTMVSGLISGWKPTFVRVSLSMDSFAAVSWLSNATQYKTPMTTVINNIGSHPNVYVLVTLRSDASMILQDTIHGDADATGVPSDSTTTPDKNAFPTGTDAVYVALVDSFASSSFVLFGLTNEPGGNQRSNATLAAAMTHAVGVIRAEEDRLGVPHHIVSVQGNSWTSDISFYATTPIARDNVVYEVHGYPPGSSMYTYSNIPVIIGEYGSLDAAGATAFFADVESKQIPTLAWDFDPYSDCAPDLLNVNQSATNLMPSAWGMIVQPYLMAHAQ